MQGIVCLCDTKPRLAKTFSRIHRTEITLLSCERVAALTSVEQNAIKTKSETALINVQQPKLPPPADVPHVPSRFICFWLRMQASAGSVPGRMRTEVAMCIDLEQSPCRACHQRIFAQAVCKLYQKGMNLVCVSWMQSSWHWWGDYLWPSSRIMPNISITPQIKIAIAEVFSQVQLGKISQFKGGGKLEGHAQCYDVQDWSKIDDNLKIGKRFSDVVVVVTSISESKPCG